VYRWSWNQWSDNSYKWGGSLEKEMSNMSEENTNNFFLELKSSVINIGDLP